MHLRCSNNTVRPTAVSRRLRCSAQAACAARRRRRSLFRHYRCHILLLPPITAVTHYCCHPLLLPHIRCTALLYTMLVIMARMNWCRSSVSLMCASSKAHMNPHTNARTHPRTNTRTHACALPCTCRRYSLVHAQDLCGREPMAGLMPCTKNILTHRSTHQVVFVHDVLLQGECYVFDRRAALDHELRSSRQWCFNCRRALAVADRQSPLFEEGVSCAHCSEQLTDERREAFRKRQLQFEQQRHTFRSGFGEKPQ